MSININTELEAQRSRIKEQKQVVASTIKALYEFSGSPLIDSESEMVDEFIYLDLLLINLGELIEFERVPSHLEHQEASNLLHQTLRIIQLLTEKGYNFYILEGLLD